MRFPFLLVLPILLVACTPVTVSDEKAPEAVHFARQYLVEAIREKDGATLPDTVTLDGFADFRDFAEQHPGVSSETLRLTRLDVSAQREEGQWEQDIELAFYHPGEDASFIATLCMTSTEHGMRIDSVAIRPGIDEALEEFWEGTGEIPFVRYVLLWELLFIFGMFVLPLPVILFILYRSRKRAKRLRGQE